MRRLVVVVAVSLSLVEGAAWADDPPPWMPAPRPAIPGSARREAEARRLRREASWLAAAGILTFAGGVALNVVALDLPQGHETARQPDGTLAVRNVYAPANWAELAGGVTLMGTGLILFIVSLQKQRQARALDF